MSLANINWYEVGSRAFTVIRKDWPVTMLVALAEQGNGTPVSGDELAMRSK